MFADSTNSATPIRFPSSANLNVYSFDRYNNNPNSIATASDFTITQNQNILAGYFTRLAIVEMVLDWGVPNVADFLNNNTLSITIGAQTVEVTLLNGFYTISSVMQSLIALLNAQFIGIGTFSFIGPPGAKWLQCLNGAARVDYFINDTELSILLGFARAPVTPANPLDSSAWYIISPYLLSNKLGYLDFVSPQLTYQQGLKDATTALIVRDVIYRWNFGWDSPTQLDADGYPIQQGYTSFVQRRYLSFPKQIKWTGTQPIGQLSFQVYDSDGNIFQYNRPGEDKYNFEWSSNILVSES
jgi:hypothetical protein